MSKQLTLVVVSDTHNRHFPAVEGDLLIHAGDMTNWGRSTELADFFNFFSGLPNQHKMIIAGNHDFLLEQSAPDIPAGVNYLIDRTETIAGLRIYGSPWTPKFYDWAFMLPRKGKALRAKWQAIPESTDVLVTHGPPHGTADKVGRRNAGCELLRDRLTEIQPPLHLFGHIHEGRGLYFNGRTLSVNASMAGHRHAKPYVLTLSLDATNRIQRVTADHPIQWGDDLVDTVVYETRH